MLNLRLAIGLPMVVANYSVWLFVFHAPASRLRSACFQQTPSPFLKQLTFL
jgi:hypothetical protein